MIRLPEPYSEEADGIVGEILNCCADSYKRSPDKYAQLMACRESVIAVSAEYRRGIPGDIEAVMLYAKGATGCDVVADAYKKKLVGKNAPGRKYYDYVLGEGIRHGRGRCPICEIGRPSELDHYLPKSAFPALSVTPANLVPICSECNKLTGKGDYSPTKADEALFHPYFEDPPSCVWLRADIHFENEVFVAYSVDAVGGSVRRRLEQMLAVYGLDERYACRAIECLWASCHKHADLLKLGGVDDLGWELERLASSAEKFRLNGWDAALWRSAIRQVDQYAEWLKQLP